MPGAAAPAAENNTWWSVAVVLFVGALYIGISSGLIAYNKTIMEKDRFPFSAGLGLLHSSFCSVAASLVFQIKPSLFPSLTNPEKTVALDRSLFLNAVLPIAFCFSMQIILSNQAYLFADIAFLQMLKETNVVWVYLFSVIAAVEVFGWRQMRLICLIMVATWTTVNGEVNFTLPGFLLQAASCFAEGVKITLQGVLLTSSGKGLDALSYMLIVMPACAIMFSFVFLLCSLSPPEHRLIQIPTIDDWIRNRWLLLGNAFVALALNFTGMLFIKCSSAVSYVLAGIMKDVMIVLAGILFMGHETSAMQMGGFTMQISLILLWSLLKTFPKQFANGFVEGFQIVFMGREMEPELLKPEAVKGGVAEDSSTGATDGEDNKTNEK